MSTKDPGPTPDITEVPDEKPTPARADGRTRYEKRRRQRSQEFLAALGGADAAGPFARGLIERLSVVVLEASKLEDRLAAGEVIDVPEYRHLCALQKNLTLALKELLSPGARALSTAVSISDEALMAARARLERLREERLIESSAAVIDVPVIPTEPETPAEEGSADMAAPSDFPITKH
jgi:hypothetical protein